MQQINSNGCHLTGSTSLSDSERPNQSSPSNTGTNPALAKTTALPSLASRKPPPLPPPKRALPASSPGDKTKSQELHPVEGNSSVAPQSVHPPKKPGEHQRRNSADFSHIKSKFENSNINFANFVKPPNTPHIPSSSSSSNPEPAEKVQESSGKSSTSGVLSNLFTKTLRRRKEPIALEESSDSPQQSPDSPTGADSTNSAAGASLLLRHLRMFCLF